jgi:hypothetical protein
MPEGVLVRGKFWCGTAVHVGLQEEPGRRRAANGCVKDSALAALCAVFSLWGSLHPHSRGTALSSSPLLCPHSCQPPAICCVVVASPHLPALCPCMLISAYFRVSVGDCGTQPVRGRPCGLFWWASFESLCSPLRIAQNCTGSLMCLQL